MGTVINSIIMKTVPYCEGDAVIKFMNDYGGFDQVLFSGNGSRSFQSKIDEVSKRRVTNFLTETGREDVLRITAGEKLEFSKQFAQSEKEGIQQMLSSRFVQMYYQDKWWDVQLTLKDWKDKVRDHAIMITIEIKLPERYINE